ncbi:putative RNA-directed DNA polymerase, eukaryota, reverse transcriptase zinc-binding domain protein, partial [Tanacetum coccineum]
MNKTKEPVIPSTKVNGATAASGSKLRSNTKKDRTLSAKSDTNKVEDHPRNNKSSVKRKNRVDSSISYKRIIINSNSNSVNNPTLITDFRPISLIGIHYKIIAKILANRLSKVIDKIVSKEQSVFIVGRQILDGPVILSEIIECPTSEFSIKRGLRQGDPLSPFLFIMVMEGLHNDFEEAVGNGLITGVNINNSTINVSHLFYADDVIITTDWNARDMDNIIRVLHGFYLALGLKINIYKSNIYGIGVNKDE